MPAYKALFILIVVGAIAACGVFYFFESSRPPFVKNWLDRAQGFTPAQSPEEAVEKFRELIKKRNYETAQKYVSGDYLEQLKIGGPAAASLGKAIDDFMYTFKETKNLKSDKVEYALRVLDPFPTDFTVVDMKKSGDDKATAVLEFMYGKALQPGSMADWKIDPNMWMALVPSTPRVPVELKKEGTGKDLSWRIVFPVPQRMFTSVKTLKDYHGNFVQALNKLNNELKNDPETVDGIERKLKVSLESAK